MPLDRAPFNALVDDTGTGTTGTVWNKAQIKGVLLDPTDAELKAIGASMYAGGSYATSLVNGGWTAISFDTVHWASPGLVAPPTNQIYIPLAGFYLVEGTVTFPVNATGLRGVTMYINGAPGLGQGGQQLLAEPNVTTYTVLTLSAVVKFLATQIVQLAAFQTSGAAMSVGGLNLATTCTFQAIKLAD